MNESPTKKTEEEKREKQANRTALTAMIFICANLAISAIFSFASLYSDCFGLGDYFKNPLQYVGFFDALAVGGFILGFAPFQFTRFVAFAIAGFSAYCGWSAGVFDSNTLPALIFNGYGIMTLSHLAVATLTFGFLSKFSIILGLASLACWITPISLSINSLLNL